MESKDGKDFKDVKSEGDPHKLKESHDDTQGTPKKRRKVNHGKSVQPSTLLQFAMPYCPVWCLLRIVSESFFRAKVHIEYLEANV
jgi:hypothetical protein